MGYKIVIAHGLGFLPEYNYSALASYYILAIPSLGYNLYIYHSLTPWDQSLIIALIHKQSLYPAYDYSLQQHNRLCILVDTTLKCETSSDFPAVSH